MSSFSLTSSGRPVMSRSQADRLMRVVMEMTSADVVVIRIDHRAHSVTHFANNQVSLGDDGDTVYLGVSTAFGYRGTVRLQTNQLDEQSLLDAVRQCEAIAKDRIGADETYSANILYQDEYVPVSLWYDSTVAAMETARYTAVPSLIDAVRGVSLTASGFVGLMARASAVLNKTGGVSAFCDETDAEVTVTACQDDGSAPGWAGCASRDWSKIPYAAIATQAVDFSNRNRNARAIEPGRRTAILGPAAVAQIARFFAAQFNARDTDLGLTAFSKRSGPGNRLHERVFDDRINMFSDPADPLGGFQNYFDYLYGGYATRNMRWVDHGVLKNLAYDPSYAMIRGKTYAEYPKSIHITGGDATVSDMISQCEEGIYVNRLTNVDMVDLHTGMMTGATSGGTFLVQHGKIVMPVKDFQILESPFFFMNNVMSLGKTERAAFGYTPPTRYDLEAEWPRSPVIVPPMMVRDFNFSALADGV